MTARGDLDRQLDTFLRDGPTELPEPSFYAVRQRTESTRQRVLIGPWRMPDPMNRFAAIGLGAAAVVVVLVIGSQVLGRPAPSGVGSAPSASPSPTPAPTATTKPSPSPPSAPPLTQSFTSSLHGYSMSYPPGWVARAATEPWTDRPGVPQYLHPGFDVLDDPVRSGELFLWTTSRPIGDSTPDQWLAALMAEWECATTEPITVDGAAGLIGAEGCHEFAAVTTAGRGYEIGLYTPNSGERRTDPIYDKAWFERVLATVRLHPEDLVAPTPSPSS